MHASTVLLPLAIPARRPGAPDHCFSTRTFKVEEHVFASSRFRVYRKNDNTHSPTTRKQIKGPLMVVATLAAIDLVQPFSGVQENVGGHATRFNRLVDPDLGLSSTTDATGPIPKSLEMMRLSVVLGLGNCGRCRMASFLLLACEPKFRRENDRHGLGGSARL